MQKFDKFRSLEFCAAQKILYTVNGEKLYVFVNESNQSRNRKVALAVATFRSRLRLTNFMPFAV